MYDPPEPAQQPAPRSPDQERQLVTALVLFVALWVWIGTLGSD